MNPYVLVIALIGFLGLGVTALWYKAEAADQRALVVSEIAKREKVEAALGIAVDANEVQAAAIKAIGEQNAREQQILADIAHKLAVNNQLAAERAAEIADLEVKDATVREFRALTIPDPYWRVLNRGKAGADRGDQNSDSADCPAGVSC